VSAGDVTALETGLCELLDDRALASSFARKGIERVHSRFVWKRTAKATVEAYRQVICQA